MKKTLSLIADIALVVFIVLAAVMTVISLSTKERGVTVIGNYIPFNIQTDSMNPTIKPGDLIITKKYAGEKIKVNDIISFFAIEQDTTIIKTHRVIKINDNNGTISYVTKGDNTPGEDNVEVTKNDIVSVYSSDSYDGMKLPIMGRVFSFLKSQLGFLFCIILPLLIFFLYQLYKFITIIIDEKKKETIKEIEEIKNKKA